MTPKKPRVRINLVLGPRPAPQSGSMWVASTASDEPELLSIGNTTHLPVIDEGRTALTPADWIGWFKQARSREGVLIGHIRWAGAVVSQRGANTHVSVDFIPARQVEP
jgi:hypothetical protein